MATYENNYFSFNGTRSDSFDILVTELPDISFPKERVDTETIPGRSGVLNILQGDCVYDEITLKAKCWLPPGKWSETNCVAIGSWLRGSGKLILGNRTSGYYNARVSNQIDIARVVQANKDREFTVNFRCQPFMYLNDNDTVTLTDTGYVTNTGNIQSEPVIAISGAGTVDFMINGYQFTISATDSGWNYTVDSQLLEVYATTSKANRNSVFSGDFPMLSPGSNQVSWSGDGSVTSVKVTGNWRRL